ncbi:MAG: hypothetical protein JWM80_329 [Cyanobacteria bacterium RYN_339]|nr:hypothetical protein [Cyanobacteria bacterium RYN_339]
MKAAHLVLSALLLAGAVAPLAGCGVKTKFEVPEPADPNAPKQIGVITVTVIDNNSKPVVGAAVTLTDAKGAAVGAPVTSGADGTAAFSKVTTGTGYTVTATLDGVTGSQAGLGIDSESPLVVKVMLISPDAGKGTVKGTVVDGLSHQPLDGATVSIVGTQNTTKSLSDGSYVLKGVPVGNPTVVAAMPGYRENRAPVAVQGGALAVLPFQLFPSGDATRLGHTLVTTAKQLLEFDRGGTRVTTIARGAYQARPLANGNTILAGTGGISEINASNTVVWSFRSANAQGVFKASNGNVFIADTNNNRVLNVSASRQVQTTIKQPFNHPLSVEREEATHTTLVADTGNNRVIEVDDAGVIKWGYGNGEATQLNHPTYATRLPNGNTIFVDTGNCRVIESSPAHRMVWMYGGDGKRETCYFPNGAQRLPNGNTLISDTGNNRVIEVNGAGKIVWQLTDLEQPTFAERL